MSATEKPSSLTPMLRQYHEIKRQHPGTLLFFRLGDFYELFFEDAIVASREMEVTLTARHKERGDPVPMCGVPYHAAAGYVTKLVRKGFRVAICEQVEDPQSNTKLVRREVVRVITPGTAIETQLLEAKENHYLAAICATGEGAGLALIDLSTGEFLVTQSSGERAWEELREQLELFHPREVLHPASLLPLLRSRPGEEQPNRDSVVLPHPSWGVLTPLEDWLFGVDHAASLLRARLGVNTLDGFGLTGKYLAIAAAGAAFHYVLETQKAEAAHLRQISYFEAEDYLVLDRSTVNNLDLLEGRQSLCAILDETETGMGARLLRQWILRPELRLERIEPRLDAVGELLDSTILRDRLRRILEGIADLERLTGKITMGRANARDLLALGTSLGLLPGLRQLLFPAQSHLLRRLAGEVEDLDDLRQMIATTITDDPPVATNETGMIREGCHPELDELRHLAQGGKSYIASMEARERSRTGIGSLKIKFNQVFGYFLEIGHTHRDRVPPDYERRQTLAQAERYTTPELKEYEARVLSAEERILALEIEIFTSLRQTIAREVVRLQAVARAIGQLDVLASLAEVAARRNYVRPVLHEGDEIEIRGGRHPIIETLGERFVPNDLAVNNTTDRLLILTGPNMGGKSVFLKQGALIVVMAQMGSYVPATTARLSLVDRIFTRVGASDNLAEGRSTFMVEMVETAHILNTATARSLVLLDEVGRGTATFDGLSLAWAIAEYLHDDPRHSAKTLFATHYHELTELARLRPGVRNYQVAVAESADGITFLRRVLPGAASKSYGLEVARLAGLPSTVLERAREVLGNLEQNELDPTGRPKLARHLRRSSRDDRQLSLLDSVIEDGEGANGSHDQGLPV
jgi:DNA mismatch repair protein MutS